MSASFETVSVVDVHKDNIQTIWPSLMLALKSATYVAIDTELSGIGNRKTLNAKLLEDRYKSMSESAKSRSIVSLGFSCFKLTEVTPYDSIPVTNGDGDDCDDENKSTKSNKWVFSVQTFNITALCSDEYIVEPPSLEFLVDHGFDFNKQYAKGISYYRGPDRPDFAGPSFLRQLFISLLVSEVPVVFHNALMDLMFLYQNLYTNLPTSSAMFLADLTEMFPNGMIDTKYVTDFQHRMPASYLEYVFRKRQRDNYFGIESHRSYCTIDNPNYAKMSDQVIVCNVKLPQSYTTDIPEEQVDKLKDSVCEVFGGHGWCGKGSKCKRSHDIDLILDLDQFVQTKKRRKRKRRRHNKENSELLEESNDTVDDSIQEVVTPMENEEDSESHAKEITLPGDILKKPVEIVRSGSHRAGFDAFMTGFILSTYIAQYGSYNGSLLLKDLGVEQMKNSIYLTGKDHPLNIVKSSFAKTSKEHRDKFMKLKVGRPLES
ncbi:target of EGR1 protein 1 [Mytilus galloprovincialis]|uniref:Target of EGR1 protein 1 n=1 Tax=Mytilus galloprovincialis TaxID=29158 RepID=A0A8B6G0N4_MYTGA|nr:target of EGR1 protein 1 [Mytilus galloprovincialis]